MATGLGIDIGSQWIKAVQIRCSGTSVTVTGAMKIPNPMGGNKGGELIPPNLGLELARAGLRRNGLLGISGREVMLKYLSTPPMPPDKLRMMIDMQIGDRLVPGAKGDGPPSLTYDYRILDTPAGLKGDMVIAAGVVKNAYLFSIFSALKKAKVNIDRTTPSAFGLVQAYLRTQSIPENETVVLVDVGHELLELAILHEKQVYFARSAPGGGKKFSQVLNKLLKLPEDKLEEFKHQRSKIYTDERKIKKMSPQEIQFQNALKEGADTIASSIRSSIMFCRTQAKMPKLDYKRIFISGGGARLRGLPQYLEQKTKRQVQILDLYTGLDLRKLDAASARCFEGEVPDMAVALGLAVLDADPSAFHFKLVPESISKKKFFWEKTVWAAAAGIVLLGGLAIPMRTSQKALSAVETQRDTFKKRVKAAKKAKKNIEEQQSKNAKLSHKLKFYAEQTRLGPVMLKLFARIREHTPSNITLDFFGPADGMGIRSRKTLSNDVFENPLRDLVLRGSYPTREVKDVNAMQGKFFQQLESIAGVEKVSMDPDIDKTDHDLGPGIEVFQFLIRLADPANPILPAPTAFDRQSPKKRTALKSAEKSKGFRKAH